MCLHEAENDVELIIEIMRDEFLDIGGNTVDVIRN